MKMNWKINRIYTVMVLTFFYDQSIGESKSDVKRILLNDQNYVDNQQMHQDIQYLKATVEQLKQQLTTVEQLKQQLITQNNVIQTQATALTDLQSKLSVPYGATYVQWGKKTCSKNGTELVYSGIGGGGYYDDAGRSAIPVCVPHDPDLGPVSSTGSFGSMYGMEYNEQSFGAGLLDKDVPCAVCRVNHATTTLLIPGKQNCYAGWNLEYRGLLATGYYAHRGASSYICVDSAPEALEGGVENQNGYILYPVKAYCGSLKCPPYVQSSLFYCVVCSK